MSEKLPPTQTAYTLRANALRDIAPFVAKSYMLSVTETGSLLTSFYKDLGNLLSER